MAKFRLNRRTVLRGAGSIAIALPWLEIDEARAQGARRRQRRRALPRRLHARRRRQCRPQGVNKWRPTGTETAPILSPILAPLKPMMDVKKLLIVDGLDMTSARTASSTRPASSRG